MGKRLKKKSRFYEEKRQKRVTFLILVLLISLSIISYLFIFKPVITTFTIYTDEVGFNNSVSLTYDQNSEYSLQLSNPGELKALKLSGILTQGASAKIYFEKNNQTYLIFDSSKLRGEGITTITGLVVGNETIPTNETNQTITPIINETINQTETNQTTPTNETPEISPKNIALSLAYQGNSAFDNNNDGIETLTGVIDFSTSTQFDWDVSYDKLCTKYEIYSEENQTSTLTCYGSSECCTLLNLAPDKEVWNETFYLNYGKYGATNNNIISAQVIYADYSVDPENPYSDIVQSTASQLNAKFLSNVIVFKDICVDTCLLSNLDSLSYNLIINVTNGTVSLDKISYSLLTESTNNAPSLLKNIPTIYIEKDKNETINLNEYFFDSEGDTLYFNYHEVENLSISINENIATLIPDKGFTGTIFSFFKTNDSSLTTVSNVFAINVTEELPEKAISNKTLTTIDRPTKWIKRIILEELVNNLSLPAGGYNINLTKVETDGSEKLESAKIKIKETGKRLEISENQSIIEMEYSSPDDSDVATYPTLSYSVMPALANKASIQVYWPVNDSIRQIDLNLVCGGRIESFEVKKSEFKE